MTEERRVQVVLACVGGMSTSMLVKRMRDEAARRGLPYDIIAIPTATVDEWADRADVLLLGPQVKWQMERIKQQVGDKGFPIADIPPMMYGAMQGDKAIDLVLQLLGQNPQP
ncbi:MAG: PTS sugar transporter subunit IIB [Symbiobacteriia bacterium]